MTKMGSKPTLSAVLTGRNNSLNLVRLCLALGVLLWHSFALLNQTVAGYPVPFNKLFHGSIMVDGFFGLSGFLVGNSAFRTGSWKKYAANRIFRIFPGLFVCLVVTAFIFAPIVAAAGYISFPPSKAFLYVALNMFVFPLHWGVGSTLAHNPFPYLWNGSIWTLQFEILAYITVWFFAKTLRGNTAVLISFTAVCLVADPVITMVPGIGAKFGFASHFVVSVFRLGLMFGLGVMGAKCAERIPVDGRLALGALVLLVASCAMPDYRTLGAIPLIYLLLYIGLRLPVPAFVQNNDFSYGAYIYAFPIQQALIALGLNSAKPWLFFAELVPIVLAFAAASWFFIEKPASTKVKAWVLKAVGAN